MIIRTQKSVSTAPARERYCYDRPRWRRRSYRVNPRGKTPARGGGKWSTAPRSRTAGSLHSPHSQMRSSRPSPCPRRALARRPAGGARAIDACDAIAPARRGVVPAPPPMPTSPNVAGSILATRLLLRDAPDKRIPRPIRLADRLRRHPGRLVSPRQTTPSHSAR